MKILIVASNMVHINNFHLPYIERFKNDGHSVCIMANGEGADFNIPFKKKTLSLSNLRQCFKIRKILKEHSFDAVYLHTSLASFLVRLSMKGMKKRPRVISTVHGYLFGKSTGKLHNLLYLSCERLLKKQTDHIIVMNNEDYKIATENRLCMGEVYLSRGMGVDFKRLDASYDKDKREKTELVYVGELSKRKNQIFLVKAMKELTEYTLTLVGDGDQRDILQGYIEKNGLSDRVLITGYSDRASEYISRGDIYVCASRIEGLPFNVMEAMYHKKPIVASRIKGHTDLLPDSCCYKLDSVEEFVTLVRATPSLPVEYELDGLGLDSVLEKNISLYYELAEEKSQPIVV
ncbi:MAG: glycosyltransferase [Clostridia bacterium]|nr:glycosyltransferase [Clostridia bacterium]